jgi:hypothetical protein
VPDALLRSFSCLSLYGSNGVFSSARVGKGMKSNDSEDSGRFLVMISGYSGGGKSTLLAELARRGHATVPEPGRRILAEERAVDGRALPGLTPAHSGSARLRCRSPTTRQRAG